MEQYIGQILDNRYELLEVIGVGGMAVVYKAMDHRLNRRVAVKVLKDEFLNDSDFHRRFHAESQAVAMMSHPNIVNVYDVSKSDGLDYIVMELIDGITLKQYMERKGMLSWRETLHFAMQIAKALEHAHSRNIIHRDIKPHNIMILKDGSVKVADFGIARVASAQNTLTKEALGSVHYISPEQARGSRVDARSDIYSLGVVMYQMLTGRTPYDGDSPVSIAIQHINGTPLLPSLLNSNIPTGLEQITMHAMCSDLSKRYGSAADMLRDMEEFRKNPGTVFSFAADGSTAMVTRPPASGLSPNRMGSEPRQIQRATHDEYDAQVRASRRRIILTGILIALGVAALGAVILYGMKLLDNSAIAMDESAETESQAIRVPNLVGMEWDKVDVTDYPNIVFVIDEDSYVYNNTFEAGLVCDQSIRGDTEVEPGTKVKIKISKGEQTDVMPYFTNRSLEYTKSYLNAMAIDLSIIEEKVYDDSIPEGFVVSTKPGEGASLKNGDIVTIFVSMGKEFKTVRIPDLTNYPQANAQDILTEYKLLFNIYEDFSSTVPAGYVITQSPAANTEVEEGSTVTLTISKGPKTVDVPSVIGMDSATAKTTLEQAGFVVNIVEEYHEYVAEGLVYSQSPAGNSQAESGSTVTIYVSLGAQDGFIIYPGNPIGPGNPKPHPSLP